MMDCDTPFLRVHTRSEHGSGTEQHAHRSGVHGVYHPLACLVGLALLNEAHLACRDAVVLRQLPLYLAVHVPSVARLVCSQIREHELRAFLRVVFVVILRNRLGAVGSLVVGVVLIMRVYHAHVESHLPRVIGGDKHLPFSSVSDRGGLPSSVASPVLANCISCLMKYSWSGVGGM